MFVFTSFHFSKRNIYEPHEGEALYVPGALS